MKNRKLKNEYVAQSMPGIEENYSIQIAEDFIKEVDRLESRIGKAVENYESTELDSVHDLLKSMDKVETNFKLMMKLRQELIGDFVSALSKKL